MATSVAKGVALRLGVIVASVSMQSAVDSKKKASGNVLVCDTGHPAERPSQQMFCPGCSEVVPYQQLKKAAQVDGGLVVLEAEDLAEASVDIVKHKKEASVTAHPAEQVELLTSTGDKAYHLLPEDGHRTAYATMLSLVMRHPEMAFMTLWAARSAIAQYRLVAHEGVLVLQERVAGSGMRETPPLLLDFNTQLDELAESLLVQVTADYDPKSYEDTYASKLAEIVATKEVVPVASAKASTSSVAAMDGADLMAVLMAAVEPKPAAKKRAPRKKKEMVTA